MYFCPNKLANYLLCKSNIKLPINNSHYVTGKDLSFFSKLMCVENELSNLTCNLKNFCGNCKNNYLR